MSKKSFFNHGHSSYRGNVMTPLNWFTGITETILLPTATYNYSNWIGVGSFILALGIILYYGYMYHHWSMKDPDRLQTEGFNLVTQGFQVEHSPNASNTKVVDVGADLEVIEVKTSKGINQGE